MKFLCASAQVHPSPKADHTVTEYRFKQVGSITGLPGDTWLEGYWTFFCHPSAGSYEVGKEYDLTFSLSNLKEGNESLPSLPQTVV